LPVSWKHSQAAQNVPSHHRDPFDRLLVAQARMEGMCLVSGDDVIRKHDLTVI